MQEEQWTKVIGPKKGWFDINLSNLWNYRDLIILFVKRDFVAVYKQTILGPLLVPASAPLYNVVFTIIFGQNRAYFDRRTAPAAFLHVRHRDLELLLRTVLTRPPTPLWLTQESSGRSISPGLTVPVSDRHNKSLTFAIQFALFLSFLSIFI